MFWLWRKLGSQLAYNIKNENGKTHLDKANTFFLGRNTKDFLVVLVQVVTPWVQHSSVEELDINSAQGITTQSG